MFVHKLTELQYSHDRKLPLRLYRYAPDGFHRGGLWFDRLPGEEEASIVEARKMAEHHMATGNELRVTNSGDELVFHAMNGKVLFPPEGAEKFWESLK